MTYKIELRVIDSSGTTTTTNITDKVEIGFSVVEKLNEELDIGSMQLKFTDKATAYGMFDTIRILIDNTLKYSMRVGGDVVSLASKKPLLYNHSLSLVEHTKILERVIISGKTFTQPTDGSTLYSIYDYINILRLIYPLDTIANGSSTRLYTIDSSQVTYLQSVEAPEFTFKDITLREALNQIVSTVDGIVRLDEDSVLSVDFFNEVVDLINSETGNYNKEIKQEIGFYATDITVDALNVVNNNNESEAIEIFPSETEFITARSDGYIFDFLKSYIPTYKPIYSINNITTRGTISVVAVKISSGAPFDVLIDAVNVNGVQEITINGFDSTNGKARVLEYQKYKTLVVDGSGYDDPDNYFQSNTIYYNYGERNITHNKTSGIWSTREAIKDTIETSTFRWLMDNDAYIDFTGSPPIDSSDFVLTITFSNPTSVDDYLFQMHYTPIPKSIRFNIDRQDLTDVDKKSTLISNQQSRIVNMTNFSNNIQGTINKIGNTELALWNRVGDIDDVYSVGDYTSEKYVLTNKEIVFYNDFYDCNYELSRNWNKLSQFISVNSEIRQFEIGEKGRTLQRDLLYKEFIEIDAIVSGSGSNTSDFITTEGVNSYLNTFNTASSYKQVVTGMVDGSDISTTLLVPTSSNGGGNNLFFRFAFNHNVDGGSYKEEINSQIATQYSSYANTDTGKLTSLKIYLIDGTTVPSGTTPDTYDERANLLPKTNVSYIEKTLIGNTSNLNIYKDNREILSMMYQLQQTSKDISKVILGRALSNKNRIVNAKPPTSLTLYQYNNFQFGVKDDKIVPSGWYTSGTATISVFNSDFKIRITGLSSGDTSYCIGDENGDILIAVNQSGTVLDTITFDFLNKRSGINYNY